MLSSEKSTTKPVPIKIPPQEKICWASLYRPVTTCMGLFLVTILCYQLLEHISLQTIPSGTSIEESLKDLSAIQLMYYMSFYIYAYAINMIIYHLALCFIHNDQKRVALVLGLICIIIFNVLMAFYDYNYGMNLNILTLAVAHQVLTLMIMISVYYETVPPKIRAQKMKLILPESMNV